MSVQFGVGTLKALTNNVLTGATVTTGAASGSNAHQLAVSSGLCMIDGVTAVISANAAVTYTEAGATGTGLMVYAHFGAGQSSTATLAVLTAADPLNTAVPLSTAICPLYRFSYGTGAAAVSSIEIISGGSATKTIGKVQNVSITLSYETANLRGGSDVFPCDIKHFDGALEGSFEFGDPTATQFLLLGGVYASGGSASGTWTLQSSSVPRPLSLVFSTTTNGITATYTVMRAFISQSTNDFSRTEYMIPSYTFQGQSNVNNDVFLIQQ